MISKEDQAQRHQSARGWRETKAEVKVEVEVSPLLNIALQEISKEKSYARN